MDLVAKSHPDGYTLGVASMSQLVSIPIFSPSFVRSDTRSGSRSVNWFPDLYRGSAHLPRRELLRDWWRSPKQTC